MPDSDAVPSRAAVAAVVFDAYGTLFDVAAAARSAAAEAGFEAVADRWPAIADAWRVRQLEYSWLRSLAGEYDDFWQITEDALDWTLAAQGLAGDARLRRRLLDLYWELTAFPDARPALDALRASGRALAILSNGSGRMLDAAIANAGMRDVFDAVLSVEAVRAFKPDPKVYQLVCDRFACPPDSVSFVSSNGWDAAAAAGFGFRSIWVNRSGQPPERLPWTAEIEVRNLDAAASAIDAWTAGAERTSRSK